MNKKVVVLGILVVCLSISIGIGFSYALWNQTEVQSGTNTFESGCFSISLENETEAINIPNGYPISDEKGMQQEAYKFTIQNTCSIYAHFSVNLEKLANSDMEDQYIKLQLNNRRPMLYNAYNQVTATTPGNTSRSLDFGGLEPEATREYTLRLWIDNEATNDQVGGRTFQGNIVVTSVAAEPTGAEYIENLLATNTETMANDDPDENVRYIGVNPNNYVKFNDELWRIIGVFYVKPNEDGNYEKRLKIIRNESIGNYSWDSSEGSTNGGVGVNEWSTSAIQKALNEAYYNSNIGTCYGNSSLSEKICDFTEEVHNPTKGLDATARNQIAKVMWNTGTVDGTINTPRNTNPKDMYIAERSDNNGKSLCVSGTTYCNDSIQRTTKWVGNVGLMYASDYGYSIDNNQRKECLTKDLFTYSDCNPSSWLFNNTYQWTITPAPNSTHAYMVLNVNDSGCVSYYATRRRYYVRPVVYLRPDVKIIHNEEHNGSAEYPYELGI